MLDKRERIRKFWQPRVENRVVNTRKVVGRDRVFLVESVYKSAHIPTRVVSRE